jgi:hypothetical protein
LGDENIRATAFHIEQEQPYVPPVTKEPDGTSSSDNVGVVVAPLQDGIVNQQETKNDSGIQTPIERSFE